MGERAKPGQAKVITIVQEGEPASQHFRGPTNQQRTQAREATSKRNRSRPNMQSTHGPSLSCPFLVPLLSCCTIATNLKSPLPYSNSATAGVCSPIASDYSVLRALGVYTKCASSGGDTRDIRKISGACCIIAGKACVLAGGLASHWSRNARLIPPWAGGPPCQFGRRGSS